MKDLLYKDYKLFWTSTILIYLLFGAFLLIPSWPYFIAFGYIIWIGFVTAFFVGRSNQDIFFSVSLPVRKKDVVLARVCTIAVIELLQIIVAAPFAVLNNVLYNNGNSAGMNVNFAFFGSIFIMYAIFNIIFLPGFYKTAYNVGKPMLIGSLASIIFAAAFSVAVMLLPVLKTNLNGMGASQFASQLPVLLIGIALFVGLTRLAYTISANRFKKVDL
jgi:ABC-2 type transport system permease protein